MLKPLGDRVLIKPHQSANETDSGLILPENRADQSLEMQGTVVAVGTPRHPRKEEADTLASALDEKWSEWDRDRDPGSAHPYAASAALLRDLVRRESCVQPGDDVLFSWTAGQEILIDDERFLLLREDDLLAVLESA